MRTRWDEVDESEGGSNRFLGFSAVTWGMAVPVAFIAGAAVMSFFDQPRLDTASLAIPAPATSDSAKTVNDGRITAQNGRWEEEARQAATKAAELQMQVEALRDQVSSETRRRRQAEETAEQTATALEDMRRADPGEQVGAATAVAVSDAAQQPQTPLSYSAPASPSAAAFNTQAETAARVQPSVSTGASGGQQGSGESNDSMALQRIIEDTASRSAAQSDRRDEMESDTTASVSTLQSARVSRSASTVEDALGRATGLDALSASQRNSLKEELVGGACVTVSLEKVFGNPVPVVPLRNLVRDLDSDC